MRFALILIASSLILLAVATLFDVNYIDYKTPIPYSEWRKINFYDFKGLKKPGMTLHGVAEFAYIKTSKNIHFLDSGGIEITTYFHPSRSYVFAQDIRNADLLTHELYHFHIAEYFSRLLREEVFKQKKYLTRSRIENLRQRYSKLENEMQDQYDEDSYHSYILQNQKKWEVKVDSLLQELQEFSAPFVPIGNKE
jgi:hypothetical protein